MRKFRKTVSAFLAVSMLLSVIPYSVSAEEIEVDDNVITGSEEEVIEISDEDIGTSSTSGYQNEEEPESDDTLNSDITVEEEPSDTVTDEEDSVSEGELYASEDSPEECEEEAVCDLDAEEDNDELFAEYVNSFFGTSDTPMLMSSELAGDRLTGDTKKLYDLIKPQIEKIAAGDITSTIIKIKYSDIFTEAPEYTNEELGCESAYYINDSNKIAVDDTAKKAFFAAAKPKCDYNALINALNLDCPYEMYWYDKTIGSTFANSYTVRIKGFPNSDGVYDGNGTLYFSDESYLVIRLSVSKSYANTEKTTKVSGVSYYYDTDSTKTQAVPSAKANADSLVDSAYTATASKTDYDTLLYFASNVKALSTYNSAAAASDYSGGYGDPWQIVYLFDGDPDTKVVCEGYSKGFQYLCDTYSQKYGYKSGDVFSYLVTGYLGSAGHMWNLVHMDDGNNYLVDITNGAFPDTDGKNYLFLAGYKSGSLDSGYVLKRRYGTITYKYGDASTDNTRLYYPEEYLMINSRDYEGECDTISITVEDWKGNEISDGISVSVGDNKLEYDTFMKAWFCENLTFGKAYTIKVSDANGHFNDYTMQYVPEKFTDDIVIKLSCSHKDGIKVIPAVEPTCTGTGLTEGKYCEICSTTLVTQKTVNALGHSFTNYVSDGNATCTADGTKTAKCDRCSVTDTVTDKDSMLPHDYDEWTIVAYPTYKSVGILEKTCKNCGLKVTNQTKQLVKTNLSAAIASLSFVNTVYSGSAQKPKATVKVNDTVISSEYYTVTYKNNKNTGIASVIITAQDDSKFEAGNPYTGTKTVTFSIAPKSTSVSALINVKSGITIKWNKISNATGYKIYRGSTLIKTVSDASVLTYTDKAATVNGTKYTYKVIAYKKVDDGTIITSDFSAAKSIYRLVSPTISSVSNSAANTLSVSWSGNTKASGYLLEYSLSSKFVSPKIITVTKNKTISKSIKGLIKGKRYYVRVVAYRTVSGSRQYSAWSAVKSVKILK